MGILCIHMPTCSYVCMCIHNIYIYIYIYVCVCVCVCVCVYVCMYVCMYVFMYVCIYSICMVCNGRQTAGDKQRCQAMNGWQLSAGWQ